MSRGLGLVVLPISQMLNVLLLVLLVESHFLLIFDSFLE
jgi:hypothetical protein